MPTPSQNTTSAGPMSCPVDAVADAQVAEGEWSAMLQSLGIKAIPYQASCPDTSVTEQITKQTSPEAGSTVPTNELIKNPFESLPSTPWPSPPSLHKGENEKDDDEDFGDFQSAPAPAPAPPPPAPENPFKQPVYFDDSEDEETRLLPPASSSLFPKSSSKLCAKSPSIPPGRKIGYMTVLRDKENAECMAREVAALKMKVKALSQRKMTKAENAPVPPVKPGAVCVEEDKWPGPFQPMRISEVEKFVLGQIVEEKECWGEKS